MNASPRSWIAPTQTDIAREALAQIGTRSDITSIADNTVEAKYVTILFDPIRDFLLVDGDYDWSTRWVVPVAYGVPAPPWKYVYPYPPDALRIRQLIPLQFEALDPRPVEWSITGTDVTSTKVVTNVEIGYIYYTAAVDTMFWDAMFRQAFVRMLASALAFALENRIEASKVKLDEALGFAGIAKLRDM